MNPNNKKIFNSYMYIVEHFKGFLLALFVIIFIQSLIVGYRYYKYTQEEPQYCVECHLLSDSYREWQKGKHSQIVCQQCHKLSLLEKNRLLVSFITKSKEPINQSHGREKTWHSCKKCHMENISQGAKTVNKYYGHARHIFIGHVECKQCHEGHTHNFTPSDASCKSCHTDKGVHGLGMEGFDCLQCHSFSTSSDSLKTLPSHKCIKCHTSIPSDAPMSKLSCHECHKPHSEIEPSKEVCMLKCHSNQVEKGIHNLHTQKGMKCLDCHIAHKWQVGKERAKKLCSKCHDYRKPQTFIY